MSPNAADQTNLHAPTDFDASRPIGAVTALRTVLIHPTSHRIVVSCFQSSSHTRPFKWWLHQEMALLFASVSVSFVISFLKSCCIRIHIRQCHIRVFKLTREGRRRSCSIIPRIFCPNMVFSLKIYLPWVVNSYMITCWPIKSTFFSCQQGERQEWNDKTD